MATRSAGPTVGPTVAPTAMASASPPRLPGFLLGVGFGGFVDGIVLHQILQWHHMLTATGDHPADTVTGLEENVLASCEYDADESAGCGTSFTRMPVSRENFRTRFTSRV